MKDAIVKMCIDDIRPFNIVNGLGLHNLIDRAVALGATFGVYDAHNLLPDATTVSRHVDLRYQQIELILRNEMISLYKRSPLGVTFSADGWTCKYTQKKHIGLLVHYIKDWKIEERCIGVIDFPSEQCNTATNIFNAMESKFQSFSIAGNDYPKTIVSDSGSNMLAMAKLYGNSIPCLVHRLMTLCGDVHDHKDFPSEAKDNITYAKTIVRHFKQSGLMPQLTITLKQEVKTRWMSLLRMLKSIIRMKDEIRLILENKDGEFYLFNKIDWDLMDKMVQFLEPVEETINFLQSSRIPTMPFALLSIRLLENNMKDSARDDKNVSEMKRIFHQLLNTKLRDQLDSYAYHVGEFFVPYLKFEQIGRVRDKKWIYEKLTKIVETGDFQIALMKQTLCHNANNTDRRECDQPISKVAKSSRNMNSVHSRILRQNGVKVSKGPETWDSEFKRYCELEVDISIFFTTYTDESNLLQGDILSWWTKNAYSFPRLALLAQFYCAIPASSAGVERIFSVCGSIKSVKRTSMHTKKLEKLVVCRSNKDL